MKKPNFRKLAQQFGEVADGGAISLQDLAEEIDSEARDMDKKLKLPDGTVSAQILGILQNALRDEFGIEMEIESAYDEIHTEDEE